MKNYKMVENRQSELDKYLSLRAKILLEAQNNDRLDEDAWDSLNNDYGRQIGRRTMERLRGDVERLIRELEDQNMIYIRDPSSENQVNVESSNIHALRPLVPFLSMALRTDFDHLCEDFISMPTFQVDNIVKSEIVDAIETKGWDFVGVDFFESLGLVQGEITYLRNIQNPRVQIEHGLLLFEKKLKGQTVEEFNNRVALALKAVDLHRVARKLFGIE